MPKIGLALIGAGIWAREQHLPSILEHEDVHLKAIYSRSQHSAEALRHQGPEGVEIYYELPPTKNNNLADLLSRADITAVIVCLPILVQLEVVKKCLQAGKHVQSEKPIAGDINSASELIKWYRDSLQNGTIKKSLIWGVGEEFRLTPAWNFARDSVAGLGPVQTFYAQGHSLIDEGSAFYETSWRKIPGYQGGFLLDGGVHWTAALTHILGEENRPKKVAAFTSLIRKHLAPVDTLAATVQTKAGISGIFAYSRGIEHKAGPGMYFETVCENGNLTFVTSNKVSTVTVKRTGVETEIKNFDSALNTRYEIQTFVKSILSGREEAGERPEAALFDLAFLQRMLESGEAGGEPKLIIQ